ncbi:hypothetical protein RFI_21696 [Reticulomyxa filosa]|uniref:Uncharacterized protein n=1 Tax=Reticulomyxa filosa TaxID=46433 RepID=X6MNU0_RETFI|nr:hypothetical protein RFI_21696 [Reticulomyxa filosa]|eukprot:ETO15668.1 hypothetical protein RFI_21696 [Reticulomyxa filosa]
MNEHKFKQWQTSFCGFICSNAKKKANENEDQNDQNESASKKMRQHYELNVVSFSQEKKNEEIHENNIWKQKTKVKKSPTLVNR